MLYIEKRIHAILVGVPGAQCWHTNSLLSILTLFQSEVSVEDANDNALFLETMLGAEPEEQNVKPAETCTSNPFPVFDASTWKSIEYPKEKVCEANKSKTNIVPADGITWGKVSAAAATAVLSGQGVTNEQCEIPIRTPVNLYVDHSQQAAACAAMFGVQSVVKKTPASPEDVSHLEQVEAHDGGMQATSAGEANKVEEASRIRPAEKAQPPTQPAGHVQTAAAETPASHEDVSHLEQVEAHDGGVQATSAEEANKVEEASHIRPAEKAQPPTQPAGHVQTAAAAADEITKATVSGAMAPENDVDPTPPLPTAAIEAKLRDELRKEFHQQMFKDVDCSGFDFEALPELFAEFMSAKKRKVATSQTHQQSTVSTATNISSNSNSSATNISSNSNSSRRTKRKLQCPVFIKEECGIKREVRIKQEPGVKRPRLSIPRARQMSCLPQLLDTPSPQRASEPTSQTPKRSMNLMLRDYCRQSIRRQKQSSKRKLLVQEGSDQEDVHDEETTSDKVMCFIIQPPQFGSWKQFGETLQSYALKTPCTLHLIFNINTGTRSTLAATCISAVRLEQCYCMYIYNILFAFIF